MPTPLFNGRDLAGWTFHTKNPADDARKPWSVRDGVLVCTGAPLGYIATSDAFHQYTLFVEYRFPAGTEKPNSGVLVHCQKADGIWPDSLEVQMRAGRAGDFWLNPGGEHTPRGFRTSGRFDDKAPNGRHYFRNEVAGNPEKPLGEWNSFVIACGRGEVVVTLNGVRVNQAEGIGPLVLTGRGFDDRGRIALQSEGSAVEFRRVEIVGDRLPIW